MVCQQVSDRHKGLPEAPAQTECIWLNHTTVWQTFSHSEKHSDQDLMPFWASGFLFGHSLLLGNSQWYVYHLKVFTSEWATDLGVLHSFRFKGSPELDLRSPEQGLVHVMCTSVVRSSLSVGQDWAWLVELLLICGAQMENWFMNSYPSFNYPIFLFYSLFFEVRYP